MFDVMKNVKIRKYYFCLQQFDKGKYGHLTRHRKPDKNHNKEGDDENPKVSLAALRIDQCGGIYLTPLLDSHNAYFKCVVAQDAVSKRLLGYALYFYTMEDEIKSAQKGVTMSAGGDPIVVLEDLYVVPKYRRRRIASELFRKVLKVNRDKASLVVGFGLLPSLPLLGQMANICPSRVSPLINVQKCRENNIKAAHKVVVSKDMFSWLHICSRAF